VPADSIIARVTPQKYDALICAAAEANFNMLRIWGGGIFEDDAFYEACDERGILVWQDFLFSCLYYPDDDPNFVQRMGAEAEFAVRRLRNHACLALWCGNNENQWIHQDRVADGTAADRLYGERIYDQVLPDVCERLDPTRPYWPSSPFGSDDYCNSETSGDRHAWQVTILDDDIEKRLDYMRYAEDRSSFVSEYGIAAPPNLDSWQRCLKPDELEYESDAWNWHRNSLEWRTPVADALERYWKPMDEMDLLEYIRAGQMIQAEALKFSIEHWRRRKFCTAGVLFWMYNDCWCETGWTIIDCYLNRKASYWAVKRAYAPVLVSPRIDGDSAAISVVNDRRQAVRGELVGGWANVRTGETIQRDPMSVRCAGNAVCTVTELDLPGDEPREAWVAWARLEADGELLSRNRALAADFRFREAGFAPVHLDWTVNEAAPSVTVTADAYAFHVHIDTPRGLTPADNDFDLLPGETRSVPLCGNVELAERMQVTALNGG
jgi:beta-mannosidase